MHTSSTSSCATPARLTLSRTTIAHSSVAVKPFKEPKSFPTGVLTALMITASLISDILLLQNYLLFTITIYLGGCQGRQSRIDVRRLPNSALALISELLLFAVYEMIFVGALGWDAYSPHEGCQSRV